MGPPQPMSGLKGRCFAHFESMDRLHMQLESEEIAV
jgi:hypothetical protein